jgi:transposase
MSDLFWLTDEQMERLRPFFPKSHGKPRVDDRRVLSGIVFVNRNGLRWRDTPGDYGPHKTLYNRWKRWGRPVCSREWWKAWLQLVPSRRRSCTTRPT